MTLDPTNPAPQPCPQCGAPILVRRRTGGNGDSIWLDPEPLPTGTYMVTLTTASIVSGKGGWRYGPHVLTCSKGATG